MAAERLAFNFTENLSPHFGVSMTLKSILFEGHSGMQKVQVIETHQFGKTLVMDGQTQSAEADEHVYHETLVHPAMLIHGNPKRVFIGGGGEFATAREVLKHNTLEKCVMVDIDKLACDMCRKHLPEWSANSTDDSRLEVHYTDAKKWLEDYYKEKKNGEGKLEEADKFDVIIMDIVDPIEAGPGYKLYTTEFYTFIQDILSETGVFVTQSGPGATFNVKSECFTVINKTLNSSFPSVAPYTVDIPSFGSCWGFNLATKQQGTNVSTKILESSIQELDLLIGQNICGQTKFLDGVSLKGLFGIAKSIRAECEAEDRVMTIDNPVFMYSG
eukprot:snap_masked-scaffold_11-processed-gene-4.30-mRNA-1 protein AED:0.00 eAED:0.00 QI:0/-1/0/1/-1/1/1/0/328